MDSVTCQNKEFTNESHEIRKMCSSDDKEHGRLIPCLPDELSMQILAWLPRIYYSSARLVSQRWKSAVSSSELFSMRKELGKTEEWLYMLTKGKEDKSFWCALDPVSMKWQRLPPMPAIVNKEESFGIKVSENARSLLGTSEKMPFTGCSIDAVDGCLYVLGGFCRSKALSCVWRFNPILNSWNEVSSMLVNRGNSKTGVLNKKLYVVGGADHVSHLQSAEVYDPNTDTWSHIPSMPFSDTQFVADEFPGFPLKPIATAMTCYNGKLCVTQSLISGRLYFDIGGEVYNPETNLWAEMPPGMAHMGVGLSHKKWTVVVNGELYFFNPSSLMKNKKIKVYDEKEDSWKVVKGELPFYKLTNPESPYLVVGVHGKLHFITRDPDLNVTVFRADVPDIAGLSSKGNADKRTPDSVIWKVIARKDFGATEVVSCHVIDI